MMRRVYISAAHKSSGKTTVSIGLCAALKDRGLRVQPFKKGPDFIDPLWLTQAAGRPCHNLDFHTMSAAEIGDCFATASQGADIAVIEGNKGLFDGVALDGSNSNAALARYLQAPVVLVINAQGINRGIAPLVIGYRHFDPDLPIAGIILNRVGGARHEAKLRAVLKAFTDVPVLGALWDSASAAISERHLGLIPSGEHDGAAAAVDRLMQIIRDHVDVGAIAGLGMGELSRTTASPARKHKPDLRIGIPRDAAFSFYYPGDLEALSAGGAELVFFDALKDRRLPEVDGLFIGGGFPETQAGALAANTEMRGAIRAAIEDGLPVYAECGGLMYLCRTLAWRGETHPMVGVLAADAAMEAKPVGHGYVNLKPTGAHPWWPESTEGASTVVPAHEFHYSRLINVAPETVYAYKVARGHGIDGQNDGIVYKNVLAGYAHLRDVQASRWTGRFLDFVRSHRHAARATSVVTSRCCCAPTMAGAPCDARL